MTEGKDFLGSEPVGKLMLRMALPTVAAQVINMLYNLVDRIYIGHIPGVGAMALTGVGVCMPLIMIVSAFAALVGNGGAPRAIGRGLMILLGVRDTDTLDVCEKLAQKCAGLRIFEDAGGKLNVSAEELGCEALVVSNFTLYGDTKKGKRPSFIAAAKPPLSVEAYEAFVAELRKTGLARVETGEFGADMKVTLTNDGPVTIVIDTDEWKR